MGQSWCCRSKTLSFVSKARAPSTQSLPVITPGLHFGPDKDLQSPYWANRHAPLSGMTGQTGQALVPSEQVLTEGTQDCQRNVGHNLWLLVL
jgi:hypothetical protein